MDGGKFLVAYVPIADSDKPCDWLTNDGSKNYQEIDAIDLPTPILNRVFKLYESVYLKLSAQPLISRSEGLLSYNRWILYYKGALQQDGTPRPLDIICFALFKVKTPGLKAGLKGHDGSKEGKQAVIQFAIKSYNTSGVFGEISPPLETKIIKHIPTVNVIKAEEVLRQLGKTDITPTKTDHYKRAIGSLGKVEKIMVGKPVLTSSSNQKTTNKPRVKKKPVRKKKR